MATEQPLQLAVNVPLDNVAKNQDSAIARSPGIELDAAAMDRLLQSPVAAIPAYLACLRKMLNPGENEPVLQLGDHAAIPRADFAERFLDHFLNMAHFGKAQSHFDAMGPPAKGVLDACLSALDHPGAVTPDLLSVIARTVRIFSRTESCAQYFCHAGAIASVATIIRATTALPPSLASSPVKRAHRPASVVPESMLTASQKSDAALDSIGAKQAVVHLFASLANLALYPDARALMQEARVASLLVRHLSLYSGHAAALVELLAAVNNLCADETGMVEDVIECRGHTTVHRLISNPAAVTPEVLVQGLHILASTSRITGGYEKEFMSTVIECLGQYPWHINVLCAALGTLGNFFTNELAHPNDASVKAVLQVVMRFEHSLEILVSGVFALAQMLNPAPSPPAASLINTILPSIPVLIRASDRYKSSGSLQTALAFLWSVLARFPEPMRTTLWNAHLGRHLVRIMMLSNNPTSHSHSSGDGSMRPIHQRDSSTDSLEPNDAWGYSFIGEALEDPPAAPVQGQQEGAANEPDQGISAATRGMTRHEMMLLFASIALMHLGDRTEDQMRLLEEGALQALTHCSELLKGKKQLSFLMRFLSQRLTRHLESPAYYVHPPRPPPLRELAKFHLRRTAAMPKTASTLSVSALLEASWPASSRGMTPSGSTTSLARLIPLLPECGRCKVSPGIVWTLTTAKPPAAGADLLLLLDESDSHHTNNKLWLCSKCVEPDLADRTTTESKPVDGDKKRGQIFMTLQSAAE
ncbi:hypothetical protein BC828DRAFT_374237 [Blastocladiella britannica]|nr:hypothetical protein BC828DRAFT_374237 [Blastocladiella britannica]